MDKIVISKSIAKEQFLPLIIQTRTVTLTDKENITKFKRVLVVNEILKDLILSVDEHISAIDSNGNQTTNKIFEFQFTIDYTEFSLANKLNVKSEYYLNFEQGDLSSYLFGGRFTSIYVSLGKMDLTFLGCVVVNIEQNKKKNAAKELGRKLNRRFTF